MKGAALHNISNGLGVVGLAKALDFDTNTIVQTLTSFQSNASDNPGRGNLLDVGGVQVLIDYAHNVHGLEALTHLAKTSRRSGARDVWAGGQPYPCRNLRHDGNRRPPET